MAVLIPIRNSLLLRVLLLVCLLGTMCVLAQTEAPMPINPDELGSEFWNDWSMRTLEEALKNRRIEKPAKNVILFIGDGMCLSTITASRILKGQQKGHTGEEEIFSYESFPNIGLSKTYNIDRQTPDSGGTATAYHTGVKTRLAVLGLNGRALWGDCASSLQENVKAKSLMEHAQESGKDTGFITTARITHASPAPLYAHCPDRRWERDNLIPESERACQDIAIQLLNHVGLAAKVVMGGGRQELTGADVMDPESNTPGLRSDGVNIIQRWVDHKRSLSQSVQYAWSSEQFNNTDPDTTDNLIGIFEASHMGFDDQRVEFDNPSIADMTEKAIRILRKGSMGYYLFVEGAGIDLAHHYNIAGVALRDTIAMELAVKRALDLVDLQDTLIIVSSDHSSPLAMVGYSTRGRSILGLIDQNSFGAPPNLPRREISTIDFKTFPILVYGTGPGWNASRPEFTEEEIETPFFRKRPTAIPNLMGTHDGSDVLIFATGAMGHLIHSTHEQPYIFHAMKYAACMTDHAYAPHCRIQEMGGSLTRNLDWIKWNSILQVVGSQFATRGVLSEIVNVMVQ